MEHTTDSKSLHETTVPLSNTTSPEGIVVSAPTTRRYVSRLVSGNSKVINYVFYLLGAIQAVQLGYDASVMNALNILPSYTDYFTLTTSSLALNTASFWVGGIISGFFGGQFCDWQGRKWTMFWSSWICIVGAVLQTASQNIGMFVAARIIVGLGCGVAGVGAATYLGEATAIGNRAFVLGFYWDCWFLGALVAAGISMSLYPHRYPLSLIPAQHMELKTLSALGPGEALLSSRFYLRFCALPSCPSYPSPQDGWHTMTGRKTALKCLL